MIDLAGVEFGDAVAELAYDLGRPSRTAGNVSEKIRERFRLDTLRRGERASLVIDDREDGGERRVKDANEALIEISNFGQQHGLRRLPIQRFQGNSGCEGALRLEAIGNQRA